MAIYHLTHGFVKRSNGSSVVSKAAYNSGEKIENNKGSTEYSDYTRKGGVLYDEVSLPAGSPSWANDRGELWRRLEAREDKSTRRSTALLANSFDIALPHELSLEQNIFLAKDFVREQFTRKGYAVDWAIHAPDPRGDSRNIHLHILSPLRKIEGESFGKKDRYTRSALSKQLKSWRSGWRNLANRHLKRYGHKEIIDERSLHKQGIKRLPTRHRGVKAKTQRKFLEAMRKAPLPKAPIIRTRKQVGADGTITIRKTIKNSALNKIGFQSSLPLSGKGTDVRGMMSPVNIGSKVGGSASGQGKNGIKPAEASASTPSPSRITSQPVRNLSGGSSGRVVKHIAKDGTVTMRVTIPASEFNKPNPQSSPAPKQPRRGWPPAALRDWALWGSKNPAKFFALWPELMTGNGGLQL